MTDEQKAAIIYFKKGVYTPNELLKKLGLEPTEELGADMSLVPYGSPDGYTYVSLDGKTHVNISKVFPSAVLKLITT